MRHWRLDDEVREVEQANTQLVTVSGSIVQALEGVEAQCDALNKGLEHQGELVVVVDEAARKLMGAVDEFTTTHQHFDAVVDELHEAVSTLLKPSEALEIVLTDAQSIDLSPYIEAIQRSNEELKAVDERSKQRQERRITEADLLIDETVLHGYRTALKSTDDELAKVARQREERLTRRATHEAATKALAAEPFDPQWLDSVNQSLVAQRQWLDSVNQSLATSHEDPSGCGESSFDEVEPHNHEAFVRELEAEINELTEWRKARSAEFESSCRFFGMPIDEAGNVLSQEIVAPQMGVH